MRADKNLTWVYTEEQAFEDEVLTLARLRGTELGATPVSSGTGAALRMLAAVSRAKAVAEVGTGVGVSGLWLLSGMGSDGVLTTIDLEAELHRQARRMFMSAGYQASRFRMINGRASDVMPRMAANSYDMVVLDCGPSESANLVNMALRMLRVGGILAITRALWNDNVADPARRDPQTVIMRQLGRELIAHEQLLTNILPVGDGLLVSVNLS